MRVNPLSPSLLSFLMILQSSKSSILWCHISDYRTFKLVIIVMVGGGWWGTQGLHRGAWETICTNVNHSILCKKAVQLWILWAVFRLHVVFLDCSKRRENETEGREGKGRGGEIFNLFCVENSVGLSAFRWFWVCL